MKKLEDSSIRSVKSGIEDPNLRASNDMNTSNSSSLRQSSETMQRPANSEQFAPETLTPHSNLDTRRQSRLSSLNSKETSIPENRASFERSREDEGIGTRHRNGRHHSGNREEFSERPHTRSSSFDRHKAPTPTRMLRNESVRKEPEIAIEEVEEANTQRQNRDYSAQNSVISGINELSTNNGASGVEEGLRSSYHNPWEPVDGALSNQQKDRDMPNVRNPQSGIPPPASYKDNDHYANYI